MQRYCVFCEIVAHKEPAEILYEDDDVIVFRNRLRWVPVMLLSIPKKHMVQAECGRVACGGHSRRPRAKDRYLVDFAHRCTSPGATGRGTGRRAVRRGRW